MRLGHLGLGDLDGRLGLEDEGLRRRKLGLAGPPFHEAVLRLGRFVVDRGLLELQRLGHHAGVGQVLDLVIGLLGLIPLHAGQLHGGASGGQLVGIGAIQQPLIGGLGAGQGGLHRGEVALGHADGAFRRFHAGLSDGHQSLGGGDLLGTGAGLDPGQLRLGRFQPRVGLVDRLIQITRVQPRQLLAGSDPLAFGGHDLQDLPGDLEAQIRLPVGHDHGFGGNDLIVPDLRHRLGHGGRRRRARKQRAAGQAQAEQTTHDSPKDYTS